jgi:hypothetical protein
VTSSQLLNTTALATTAAGIGTDGGGWELLGSYYNVTVQVHFVIVYMHWLSHFKFSIWLVLPLLMMCTCIFYCHLTCTGFGILGI